MGQNQASALLTSAHSADGIRDFRKGQVFTPFDHKHNTKTHQPTNSIDDDLDPSLLQGVGLERNTSNNIGSKRKSFKFSSNNSNSNNRRRRSKTTAPTPTAATRVVTRMSCYYGTCPVLQQQQQMIQQQELQRKQEEQKEKRTQRRKSFNIISRKNSNMF
nr:unnamed protein product [Naegleria fowleri]